MSTKEVYQSRRHQLAKKLPNNVLVVIPAAKEFLRNGDAHYRFRQDSDFYYLTGFEEPEALLVISTGSQPKSILFNQPRDKAIEQWTGTRLGQEDACQVLGVDDAFSITELDVRLPELFADKEAVYYPIGRSSDWDKKMISVRQKVVSQSRRGMRAPEGVFDIAHILGEMRLFKDDVEISLMQQVADISVAAHLRAMQKVTHLEYEYQLEAELAHEILNQGCRNFAYDPIVASGHNACILHYTENNKPLAPGELVLIDAGGEYNNYAADITRTFPQNGRFSNEQKAIYDIVLRAQKAGIEKVRPGQPWIDIQTTMVEVITSGLVELGILKGQINDLIAQEAYKPFYMHQSGHWLGLDVHDVGQYKVEQTWRALQPNMVLTVEPGIYIHRDIPNVDARWHGIGVRIEDDILVTQEGNENLTKALPTEIEEVEAYVSGQ